MRLCLGSTVCSRCAYYNRETGVCHRLPERLRVIKPSPDSSVCIAEEYGGFLPRELGPVLFPRGACCD